MIAGLMYMILGLLLFSIFSLVVLAGSGLLIIRPWQKELTTLERLTLSPVVGLAFFGLALFIGSILQIRFLVTPLFFLLGGVGIFLNFKRIRLNFGFLKRIDLVLLLILTTGVAAQCSLVFLSGWNYGDGIKFFGANAHDGIWHLSLIESLAGSFPPANLTFSGVALHNYHYLSDFLSGELIRIFPISPLDLFFRFWPLFYSGLYGLLIFTLTFRLTKNKLTGYLAVILGYFAGSFGYIEPIFGRPVFSSESVFWSSQSISLLINPPLISSFVLILGGFLLFDNFISSKSRWLLVCLSVIFGVIIGFKAYGGILVLIGLFIVCGFMVIFVRQLKFGWLLLITASISLTLFLATTGFESSALIWSPGWFIQSMMVTPDHLNQVSWELARQTYLQEQNYKRVTLLWLVGLVIFLAGNLGMRIISILAIRNLKFLKKTELPIWLLLSVITLAGMAIPLLFLQKGIVWNSIQFFYYSLLILNITAALMIINLTNKFSKTLQMIIIFLFIALSIPTTFNTLQIYGKEFVGNANLTLSDKQLQALTFLKSQKDNGVVLSSYHDSAYISAMSSHPVYFEDEAQALLLGNDYSDRLKFIKEFFCKGFESPALESLKSRNIRYIYIQKSDNCNHTPLQTIYKNDEVEILIVIQ